MTLVDKIVPTLCVGMPQWTLRVRFGRDAERPGLHSHAERGNDHRTNKNAPTKVGAFSCAANA
ncbi:hypothetical protein PFAS1_21020 [Pseudomonas frederiksbergensis]|nr:hypothetical protein PFAS1_21020 [Pseudomonas frederiksbergensis]